MKRLFLISILIAVLAAFFASANPDGLDFVGEKLGFSGKGVERTAPMADYGISFFPEGGISTATAGIAGVLLTLSIFWLVAFLLKKENKGMKKTLTFLVVASLFIPVPAFAARPLVTDDFGTLDVGKYEFEAGFNSITQKMNVGSATTGLITQFKRGMSPSLDVGIELPYSMGTPSGLGDAVLHAKLKLKDLGDDEGLAIRADVKLSNGDPVRSLGSGYLDYGALFIFSKKMCGLRAHLNAGYSVVGDSSNSCDDDTFTYGAAIEKELSGGVDIAAEYTGMSCRIRNIGNVQIAGRWQAFEAVRFDAGYSIGLTDLSNNIATFGITAEF